MPNAFPPPEQGAGRDGHSRGTIRRIVGVYGADGTIWGEFSYLVGSIMGRRHCSLCDISHHTVRTKGEWRRFGEALDVPLETYHRDDQPDDIREFTGDETPVIVAETENGLTLILDDGALESCEGSVDAFRLVFDRAVDSAGLMWPTPR